MKIKNILIVEQEEENQVKGLEQFNLANAEDNAEIKETINKYCKNHFSFIEKDILTKKYYDDLPFLWRGFGYGKTQNAIEKRNINIMDSTANQRTSRNTFNFYTIIMDGAPQWKGYPKRSESFICSTSYDYAADFGEVYIVLPFDGINKFGICSQEDLWLSFLNYENDKKFPDVDLQLDAISNCLAEIFFFKNEFNIYSKRQVREINNNMLKNVSYQDLMNKIEQEIKDGSVIKLIRRHGEGTSRSGFYTLLQEKGIKIINDLISPESGKIKLTNYENIPFNSSREVWFSGKALLLPRDLIRRYFMNILNVLNKEE